MPLFTRPLSIHLDAFLAEDPLATEISYCINATSVALPSDLSLHLSSRMSHVGSRFLPLAQVVHVIDSCAMPQINRWVNLCQSSYLWRSSLVLVVVFI